MTDAPKPTLTEAERIEREADVLIEVGHPSRPDRHELMRQHIERIKAAARREALLAFADTRGVNVGDEDTEWWQGYRQAQRECLRDATDAALAEPERDEEGGR